MLKNAPTTYGSIGKLLHWSIALLIIGLISLGLYMTSLEGSDQKWSLYGLHKSFGMIVLVLVTAQVLWRILNIKPELPHSMPAWQKTASKLTHLGLYGFMVVYPLSGFLMSVMGGRAVEIFGILQIPAFTDGKTDFANSAHTIHVNLTYFAIGLISFHTLAALYHHFVVKDDVLKRMLRG
jgi:cytochrome b561